MRWRRRSRWLFAAGCALVVSALFLLAWLYSMDSSASYSASPQFALQDKDAEEDDGFVSVDWEYWKQINPDIKAWVTVDGTSIDYPIVQGPTQDPTFYLHHDAYGNYSVYGVPYFDSDCIAADSSVFNMMAFGHHMDNGSMFSDFASFSNEEYAREHSLVRLQTPTKKLLLHVAFVRIVDGSSNEKAIHFPDNEAFEEWYVEQREMADVVLEPEVVPSSIYTFCTCSYNRFANERTLVVCYVEERRAIDSM